MPSPNVLVAVPTAGRRKALFALIDFLAAERSKAGANFDFVVLVNAPEVSDSLTRLSKSTEFTIRHVPEPGLATVRNAALDAAADYDFVAFVDDDEVPVSPWPRNLVDAADTWAADVAMGSIVGKVDGDLPWWMSGPELIRPTLTDEPGRYDGEVYSSNTLIRMSKVTELGLHFNTEFNTSGAEDTDFFRRLRLGGGTVVWVPNATVIETLDADRMRLSWYLHRCASESAMLWILDGREGAPRRRSRTLARRLARTGRGLGRIIGGTVTLNTARGVAGLSDLATAGGTFAAAVGWRPAGYAQP